ncbi:MAG: succinyldiaminopimelate transaminase [Cyanobacteria bacterium SZAS LIN-3]|nr:succinyldiaminopimelate transaminase [Cyanobacteria bacterium SZAS LIN-3]
MTNSRLLELQPYPFERLHALLSGSTPPADKKPIAWSIGEPKHAAPPFIAEVIAREIGGLSNYPLTAGEAALREAICQWLTTRFKLKAGSLDKEKHVLPCNGTREALFAIAQAVVDAAPDALVLMPNPFYQIYEGAVLLAGARPHYLNVLEETLCPDFDSVSEEVWRRCQLIYICTPGNPTGAVLSEETLQKLIGLARKFDFVIASDECYSELYPDEDRPPVGLLQAAAGLNDNAVADPYKNCLVFHSLSKRSNLPGMRSGFIAGDPDLMAKFKLYRTYHGCAMPPPFQKASIAAWQDEEHVRQNRAIYRRKFERVLEIIAPVVDVRNPDGAFYLWPRTPMPDTDFARLLFEQEHLTVVPGSYLSRLSDGVNPGLNRVRMALVAPLEECVEGAERFRRFVEANK